MKYISLKETCERNLPFYLAMEEWVALHLDAEEAFFMWQVNPTVIFGRNQLIEKEVNLAYCKEKEIATYRRKSGGGCVYADRGNIMLSYITKTYNVADAYSQYVKRLTAVLNNLGVNAVATGRNDIEVDGRKISGTAFYHRNGRSVVHGTMLFDTDMQNMLNAITPDAAKIASKGVDSVRSRITTLKDLVGMNIEEFKAGLKAGMCDEELVLDDAAEKDIAEIEKGYLRDEFIYGNNPKCNIERSERVADVGEIKALVETNKGVIKNVNLMGDFFVNEDLDEQLIGVLTGVAYKEDAIRAALAGVNVADIIMNMDNEKFIKLII